MRDILNAAGQIIDHIDYDAWGRVLSETNPGAGDGFKFTGQWYDSVTGLYDYLNRWYDPQLQRFLSQDPLGWLSGQSNPYAYVGNSPPNFMDPTGLFAGDSLLLRAGLSVAGGVVGGVTGYVCGFWEAYFSDNPLVQKNAVAYGWRAAKFGAAAGVVLGAAGSIAPTFTAVAGGAFASVGLWGPANGRQLLVRTGCILASTVIGYGFGKLGRYLPKQSEQPNGSPPANEVPPTGPAGEATPVGLEPIVEPAAPEPLPGWEPITEPAAPEPVSGWEPISETAAPSLPTPESLAPKTLTPVRDPARPVYQEGHAGEVVNDHVLSRSIAEAQGRLPEALDPSNIQPKPYEMNARKGGCEGQYLEDRQSLIDGGLTPEQADVVLEETLHWLMNDALPRPMDPSVLDSIPSPGSE